MSLSSRSSRRLMPRTGLVLASAFVFGCDAVESPTGVDDPNLAVGDYVVDESTVAPGVVLVCAFYPGEDAFGVSTFSGAASAGEVYEGDFTIEPPPNCFEVWNAEDASTALVSATLVDHPANLVLDRIITVVGDGPRSEPLLGVNSATVEVSDAIGGNIWFKFERKEAPPSGGEGCTPGYWRQEHHFDSWTDYDPSDLFSSVFADAFPGETLLDVVWARGGGVNALGRHAVAALLNASSPGVDYDYTASEVIELFNAAYASGDRATMNNQKDVFDFLNNQGCGLN